jgi:C4-type Zn-finger protein
MMLTSIPYFKEVIVSSFRCEHCGSTNNEVQSAGAVRGRSCHSFLNPRLTGLQTLA